MDNNYQPFFDAFTKTLEPPRVSLKELFNYLKSSPFFFSIERKKSFGSADFGRQDFAKRATFVHLAGHQHVTSFCFP